MVAKQKVMATTLPVMIDDDNDSIMTKITMTQ